jgi:hypothetical protein
VGVVPLVQGPAPKLGEYQSTRRIRVIRNETQLDEVLDVLVLGAIKGTALNLIERSDLPFGKFGPRHGAPLKQMAVASLGLIPIWTVTRLSKAYAGKVPTALI